MTGIEDSEKVRNHLTTVEIINGLLSKNENIGACRLTILYALAIALDNLCVCYRLGKKPSEKDLEIIYLYKKYLT